MESIVDVLFQFRNPASQSQISSLSIPVCVSIDVGHGRPEGRREPPPPIQPHGRPLEVGPRAFCRIACTICQSGQAGARMLRPPTWKVSLPDSLAPWPRSGPRSLCRGATAVSAPSPTMAITGDARGPGPLAGTGPCDVVDRISDQCARRLAATRPTPATPSRPTSAMATPVFAPVLASLLPSVLLPPVGCTCSGVGWDCSGVGSSGKSHVEDCEVSDSTMAAPLVVVPEIFTSGVTSALPAIRNENFTDPLAGSSRFLKVRTLPATVGSGAPLTDWGT